MESVRLSLSERKELLALARSTLEERLEKGVRREEPDRDAHPGLWIDRGAFVTLTRSGRLRGCIGTFRPRGPLHRVVREMALAAAFHDPRFPPLRTEELPSLELEISALTPLREVTDVREIQVGTHGIHVSRGGYAGVLLPQVAVEYGWEREEFLEHTCIKAGLPADAWRKGATMEVFGAEVFSESDPEGGKVAC